LGQTFKEEDVQRKAHRKGEEVNNTTGEELATI